MKALDDLSEMNCVAVDSEIPVCPCVYLLFNGDELIYIGQTSNLKTRVQNHINKNISGKIFDRVFFLVAPEEEDRLLIEKKLIDFYRPKYNGYTGLECNTLGISLSKDDEQFLRYLAMKNCRTISGQITFLIRNEKG